MKVLPSLAWHLRRRRTRLQQAHVGSLQDHAGRPFFGQKEKSPRLPRLFRQADRRISQELDLNRSNFEELGKVVRLRPLA